MKFSLFAHMERLTPHQSHAELYDEFIALAEIADHGGMHALWTGEHHGMDFTIAPNPFINLADLARRTTNLRLGTGTVVAPFWHPIKLAGEAAMCDIVTGGRLDLGIARGAYHALDALSWERIHDPVCTAILQRYAAENAAGRFGIYVCDAEAGDVRPVSC